MENLEPKREERSPISSLKFQRKSDYKKFRNFIKKETKELPINIHTLTQNIIYNIITS